MGQITTLATGFSFLEGPRWHENRLWCSDFYTHRVLAISGDGSVEEIASVPTQPSGLGWLPDGRLLVISMRDHTLLRREANGELVVHADLSDLVTGHLNDMVVDDQGRAYVGNFGFDLMAGEAIRTANIVRVDPDGTCTVVAEDLRFPNGSVITPDGSTLIVGESVGNRLSAFDIRPDGSLGERRDWASFGAVPTSTEAGEALGQAAVAPDGISLDAEGAVWVADAIGGRAVRVVAGGEIVDEVNPGTGVFACMLGGPDGTTLHLCTAPSFAEHERVGQTDAALMTIEVDVPHAGRP